MDLTLLGALLYLACGGAVFLLAAFVLRESPGDRLRRVTASMMLFGGFGPLLAGFGMLLEARGGGGIVLSGDLPASFAYVWEFFFPSLLLFSLVFPAERSVIRRFPHLWALLYVPYLFHLVFVLFLGRIGTALSSLDARSPIPGEGGIGRILELGGSLLGLALRLLARFHIRFFSFVDLVYIALAIVILSLSLRQLERPKFRRQLKVILFGLGSCVGLYAVAVPLPTLFSLVLPGWARMILVTAGLLVGTGSIAFAIVRTSFLDVGMVFRRAFLYSATVGGIILVFYLTARQMDRVLQETIGYGLPLFQGLFAILAVVFFQPIMGKVEEYADRVMAGDRVAHRNVIQRLGREMTTILDLPTLAERIRTSLQDALAVDRVVLFLRGRGGEQFAPPGGRDAEAYRPIPLDHPLMRRVCEAFDPVSPRELVEELVHPYERQRARGALESFDSRLLVPLHFPEGEGCLGFLSLGPKVTGGRYKGEDIALLSMLATQVGFAVRNALLHEEAVERRIVDEEIALAQGIQESIVPQRSTTVEGLDVAAMNVPSRQMGGDYYDLIPLGNGTLGIAVGDVSGKGIPAALLMSMLHAALHVQIDGAATVSSLMERLNRILCQSSSKEQFATFFFGTYDRGSGVLNFTNGGHNFPIVLRRNGSMRLLSDGGLMLGFVPDIRYDEGRVVMEEGDLVVLYTDGVTEESREDDEQFGEERLIETVLRHRGEPAHQIVEAVREEVSRFSGRESFADDFTLIVLRAGEGVWA